MLHKKPRRTDQEWLEIITQCRTSGLSDTAWCNENNISLSTFYNRISRLKKKACTIPEPSFSCRQVKQEVVQLDIFEDVPFASQIQETSQNSPVPALTVSVNGFQVGIHNHADSDLIKNTILVLQSLC